MSGFTKVKSEINLVELIESYGFSLDEASSSRHSPYKIKKETKQDNLSWILRRGKPDHRRKSYEKIGVSLVDGRWLYIDNRAEETKHGQGSVIDWLMVHHKEINTAKEAILYLENKKLFKKTPKIQQKTAKKPKKETDDPSFENFEKYIKNKTFVLKKIRYLEFRNIKSEVYNSARFKGSIRVDKRNNAVFVHKSEEGITGYSLKNISYEAFSKSGKRRLWCSNCFKGDTTLVVTESGIDALAYYQYKALNKHFELDKTRFMSIDGRLTKPQIELLLKAFKRVSKVVLAFDDDKAGAEYEEKILEEVEENTVIERELAPFGLSDFAEIFESE